MRRFPFPSQFSPLVGCTGAPVLCFTPLRVLYHLTNLTCRAGVVLLHDNLEVTFSSPEADFWFCMES